MTRHGLPHARSARASGRPRPPADRAPMACPKTHVRVGSASPEQATQGHQVATQAPGPHPWTSGPGDSQSAAYARQRGHPTREFGILRPPAGGSSRRCTSRWTDPGLTAAQAATSCESACRPQRSSWSWGCPSWPAVPAAGIRPRRHPRRPRTPEARNRVGPARSCLFPSTPAKREGSPHRPHTPPVVRHRRRPLASPQRTPARTTDPNHTLIRRLAGGIGLEWWAPPVLVTLGEMRKANGRPQLRSWTW